MKRHCGHDNSCKGKTFSWGGFHFQKFISFRQTVLEKELRVEKKLHLDPRVIGSEPRLYAWLEHMRP